MDETELVLERLRRDGIVVLPGFVTGQRLRGMQQSFATQLERLRINNIDGYEKTEDKRDMVEDALLLDQGFIDVGLDPMINEVVRGYVGPQYQLVQCKGWRTRTVKRDWQGWHGDVWYDQAIVTNSIPLQLKVCVFLTNVTSGGLGYIPGSHRHEAPRLYNRKESISLPRDRALVVDGPAGTIAIFDTSGIHRQMIPVLQPRHAVFYCYHDPSIPLHADDLAYNCYHPLRLNAAFLGNLSSEQQRILGFGDKRQLMPCYRRLVKYPISHGIFTALLAKLVWFDENIEPVLRRCQVFLSRLRRSASTVARL